MKTPPNSLMALDNYIAGQKPIFVGKALEIDWQEKPSAIPAGMSQRYGTVTFECTIPIRRAKKGERIALPIARGFPMSSADISPETMDSWLFYDADIQLGSQWLVLVGVTSPQPFANPGKIAALAYCPKGDESVVAETKKAVDIDNLPADKKYPAMAEALKDFREGQAQVLLPYICQNIVEFRERRLQTADLLNIHLADPAVEPAPKKRKLYFSGQGAKCQLTFAMQQLRYFALNQPDEEPQTDVALKVPRLLLEDAPAISRQQADVKSHYASCLVDMLESGEAVWLESLEVSDGPGIVKALEQIEADQEVTKQLAGSRTSYGHGGIDVTADYSELFKRTLTMLGKKLSRNGTPATGTRAGDAFKDL